MNEEADLVLVATLAQRLGQRNQMIVVHPNHVIGAQHLLKAAGEEFIDPKITAEIAAGEFRKIEPVMQDWPQYAIGKAVVEFLVIVLLQANRDIGNAVTLDRFGRLRLAVGDLTVPAEPEAAALLERRPNRDFEPAGPLPAVGNAYTIGDYDEARQYRSPQLRDNLIALKINPDIEYVCGKLPHSFPVTECTSSDNSP